MSRQGSMMLAALALAATGAAAQDVSFDPAPVEACLAAADDAGKPACIGLAASACVDATEGGYTTVGMGACLDAERRFWDDRLNEAYSELMAKHGRTDAELDALGSAAPREAPALRAMQRAWIPFRDAACDYERSWWGGGTGGGPATLACLMRETGAQALRLELRLVDEDG